MGSFKEYLKLVRLPGWGAYSITALFGALSVGVFDPLKLFLLMVIGIFATLFGFVLNDYIDVETDKLSKEISDRPLVKGTITRNHALYITIFAFFMAFLVTILAMNQNIFLFRYEPLVLLLIAAFLSTLYNVYGKKITGSDIFPTIATTLFCVFGAVVVSKNFTNLLWIITIVTFIQVFYLHAIINGFKDADHDSKTGSKNIAFKLGLRVNKKLYVPFTFKFLGISLRTGSLIFMFMPIIYFDFFPYYLWQPAFMVLMFVVLFYLTIKMLNLKEFNRDKIRKLISLQAFLRYSIVPIMLFKFIGYQIAIFLIFFPFLWFIGLNWLIYKKTVQPKTL